MDIIGHKKEIEGLKRQIENNNISHGYLFQGREGLGKKKLAKLFSKTLLCREKGLEPCNICDSCLKFDGDNHPDFYIIEGENKIIRKNQIDELVDATKNIPFESDRKIFIIDGAEQMNKESMNGLLKTLEEPPSFLNIILITSRVQMLLPTIVSRCQEIKFYPVDRKEIIGSLEKEYGDNQEKLEFLVGFSNGAPGLIMEMLESETIFEIRDRVISLLSNIVGGIKTSIFTYEAFFQENKENIDFILDLIIYWFRDLAIYKSTGNLDLLVNKDKEIELAQQSILEFNKINDIIKSVEKTRENIASNVNYTLSIEMMLLNI